MGTEAPSVTDGLLRRLRVSARVMEGLPELPDYNGSILKIDDEEAARIAADLDAAVAEIKRLDDALKAYRPDAKLAADGFVMVPREPTGEMLSAILCSKARDDEGEFPMLLDLLDYSGENKSRTVAKAIYAAIIGAAPSADGWVAVGPGTMPPESAEILVTGWVHNKPNTERFHVVVRYTAEGFFYNEESDNEIHPPTHWQPLPDPPTGAA